MPKKSKKECTIHCHQINYGENFDKEMSLANSLRACLQKYDTPEATMCDLQDGRGKICHREIGKSNLKLHIAKWTDRENASTVLHQNNQDFAELGSNPPGDNWDYLDGEGMILIAESFYFVITNRILPNVISQYLRNLLHKALNDGMNIPDQIDSFILTDAADLEQTQKVYDEGVKKFELNIGHFMDPLHEQEEELTTLTIVERIRRSVLDVFVTKEKDKKLIAEAENIRAKLIISLDKRNSGLTSERLTDVTKEIAENYSNDLSFVINENSIVRRGDLVLKKKVMISSKDKTIFHNEAWEEMNNYYNELLTTGKLSL